MDKKTFYRDLLEDLEKIHDKLSHEDFESNKLSEDENIIIKHLGLAYLKLLEFHYKH